MADDLYDNAHIDFLEDIWGEGFLSPGGTEEVARVLDGLDLSGTDVLDIGCGSGAITVALARDYGARHVTGLDVEGPVCDAARRRVTEAGLEDRVEIRQVSPGPLDLADNSFDIVFSKDSILHIHDKDFLAGEVFRVLRPGGWFAASDWMISHDGPPSEEMRRYIALEDLDFAMASPDAYHASLEGAGFTDIRLTNRNPWYAQVSRQELDWLTGPERARLDREHGAEFMAQQEVTWTALVGVLESGEHCPHHIRARKPV